MSVGRHATKRNKFCNSGYAQFFCLDEVLLIYHKKLMKFSKCACIFIEMKCYR